MISGSLGNHCKGFSEANQTFTPGDCILGAFLAPQFAVFLGVPLWLSLMIRFPCHLSLKK